MKNTRRNKQGKYDFNNMELICMCGHKLGVHSAETLTNNRACFNGDCIDGATGKDCNCKNFKPKK